MRLETLHPDRDDSLYRTAWNWRDSYPRLVRRWDMVTNYDQWMAMMAQRVSVGVFTNKLIALVTLEPTGDATYEVHIDCERRVDIDALYTALLSMRRTVFTDWQAREVFMGVISRNGAIIRLAEVCGFKADGIEERVGRLRWIRMRMTADEFKKDDYWYLRQQGNVLTDARCVVA